MICAGLNLVVPEKPDVERDRVAEAWQAHGGSVTRLGRFWEPPALDRRSIRIYANDTFALVLAQKLDLTLVSPPDDLLVKLDPRFLRRTVHIRSLQAAAKLTYPMFVKPVVPKQFKAAVYEGQAALWAEAKGLEPETLIYVAEPVTFEAEARAFILAGSVVDVAIYEGRGDLGQAQALLDEVARSDHLPQACVLDVGHIKDRGWAVVEANAAWGSGLNGCVPEKVLSCIAHATRVATLPDNTNAANH